MLNNKRCKGSALVSALFIMTLIAIAATAMSTRLRLDIYRTQLSINSDKLYLASQAVMIWTFDQLSAKDLRLVALDERGKVMDYPKKFESIYPNTILKGEVFDLQARFNLNNLQDKKYQTIFYNLLENRLPKSDTIEPRDIVEAIINWISPYQPDAGRNRYFSYYMTRKPAYYPGYQLMQDVSELRSVFGITPDIYKMLVPELTTLPEVTPLNINTASKSMLQALGSGMTDSQIEEIIRARGKKGIKDLAPISPILNLLNIPKELITLQSTYFLNVAHAWANDMHLTVYTIIKRFKNKRGEIQISVVRQQLNTA